VGEAAARAAELTDGIGGRDIRGIVQRATQTALKRALSKGQPDAVTMDMDDLLGAIKAETS